MWVSLGYPNAHSAAPKPIVALGPVDPKCAPVGMTGLHGVRNWLGSTAVRMNLS